ncbi:helix-turn-helix domain-containing protein [Pedobacter fastidiosus]|uniref:Helix-turn-helix transcriptional regulator n=1 Tax=Pedobacter fastidiosus TaxID=2765361 RepID=A0ABR7KRE0_9SPHI|nr:helix-turn-helix transcriptional regulator [Pedobacter fastidiosus]MBC6110620.1 helix-turn-helix transcriptional regulator [Pedobacter fastidiosus]
MKIGFLLKELRSLKGVTQLKIANLLNVERSTYCKWETDKVTIDIYRLKDIAKIYGLDLEFMCRCFEAQKIISRDDVLRAIQLAEAKTNKIPSLAR